MYEFEEKEESNRRTCTKNLSAATGKVATGVPLNDHLKKRDDFFCAAKKNGWATK